MSGIKMEKMEVGNLAYAEVEDKKYVGAAEEWCVVETSSETPSGYKFTMVTDATLSRRLHRAYVEMNFQDFGSLVKAHLAKRGGSR